MKIDITQRLIERFKQKYIQSNKNECWEWKAYKNKKGYGSFFIKKIKGQVFNQQAHRVSYIIHNGHIENEKLLVLHTCDYPSCVNPLHLKLGTAMDNTQDMMSKNRYNYNKNIPKGSKSYQAIIDENIAKSIKEKQNAGYSTPDIAKELNISAHIVFDIKRNKTWKHVIVEDIQ